METGSKSPKEAVSLKPKKTPQELDRLSLRRKGRKILVRETMVDEAYRLGALGLTMEEIADFWNCSPETLFAWQKRYPEFKAAIARGRDHADQTVIAKLLALAQEGNIAAVIFWLKNRRGWKDVHDLRGSGFGGDKHYHRTVSITFAATPSGQDGGNGSTPVDLHAGPGAARPRLDGQV